MRELEIPVINTVCITALLLLGSAGCSDSDSDAKDAGGAEHAGGDAGKPDAGRRVKERFVAIDLVRITTRELTQGDDGKPVYGELQPLAGADVCIRQRRDAFQPFEPFEPLDEPICVKSVADQVVHIDGAPANSDLVVTVEHEGMRPWVITETTGDFDEPAPGWAGQYSVTLVETGAEDPFVESEPTAAPENGLVTVVGGMWWIGNAHAKPELVKGQETLFGRSDGIVAAPVQVVVEPAGGDAFEMTTSSGLSFVSLPAGNLRVTVKNDNPRVSCATTGLLGFVTDASDTLEMPVLAGHDHFVAILCQCANGPGDGELLNLATCTFAPADSSDADAGRP